MRQLSESVRLRQRPHWACGVERLRENQPERRRLGRQHAGYVLQLQVRLLSAFEGGEAAVVVGALIKVE